MMEHGYEVERINDPYPEIQADTIEETIVPGLEWLMKRHNMPMFIDDSGLFVDALKGFPGVYSSYVFRTVGCDGVLRLMQGVQDRSARFECCIGFLAPGGKPHVTRGVSKGAIALQKAGSGGFGYDPIFVPEGYSKTFAQIEIGEKNRISHRGRAMDQFIKDLPRLL